jgi:hypothetical protein
VIEHVSTMKTPMSSKKPNEYLNINMSSKYANNIAKKFNDHTLAALSFYTANIINRFEQAPKRPAKVMRMYYSLVKL